MAKRRSVSVSWHEASGQFVKWVGYSRGADGKRRPKAFYLGDNESSAVGRAVALRAEWKALKESGRDAWPLQNEPSARTPSDESFTSTTAQNATVPARPRRNLTIEEASK